MVGNIYIVCIESSYFYDTRTEHCRWHKLEKSINANGALSSKVYSAVCQRKKRRSNENEPVL